MEGNTPSFEERSVKDSHLYFKTTVIKEERAQSLRGRPIKAKSSTGKLKVTTMRLVRLIRLFVREDDKSLFENDLQFHLENLAVMRNQMNSF